MSKVKVTAEEKVEAAKACSEGRMNYPDSATLSRSNTGSTSQASIRKRMRIKIGTEKH